MTLELPPIQPILGTTVLPLLLVRLFFSDFLFFLFDYIQHIILLACIHYLLYIYFYCIYFSEILAHMRYSLIRVEIKFTTYNFTSMYTLRIVHIFLLHLFLGDISAYVLLFNPS